MVLKYADGYLPEPGREGYQPEMGELLGLYRLARIPARALRARAAARLAPPAGEKLAVIEASERFLAERANKEAEQPPAYYLAAGAWLRLGRALGSRGRAAPLLRARARRAGRGRASCSSRTGSCAIAIATKRWCAGASRCWPPSSRRIRSSTSRRTCSRRCSAALLRALAAAREAPQSGAPVYAAAGAGARRGAAHEVDERGALVVAAAASLHAIAHAAPRPPLRRFAAKLALQWALALAPVALWCERSLRAVRRSHRLGAQGGEARLGPEAARRLARRIRCSRRPARSEFGTGLVPTFWRGELAWHRTDLALPAWTRSTPLRRCCCSVLALAGLRGREPARFLAEGLATLALAVAIAACWRCSRWRSCSTRPPIRPRAGPTSCRGA